MTTTTRRTAVTALAALSVLGLGACGSSTQSAAPATSAPAATAQASSDAAAPAASSDPTQTVTVTATARATRTATQSTEGATEPTESAAQPTADGSLDGDGDALYGPARTIGATITQRQDIDIALQGTSGSFVTYATAVFDKAAACGQNTTMTVDRWYPNGLATGGITSCDSRESLWFQKDGQWREFGLQAVPTCDEVRQAGVPRVVPTETGFRCTEQGSSTPVRYSPSKG